MPFKVVFVIFHKLFQLLKCGDLPSLFAIILCYKQFVFKI